MKKMTYAEICEWVKRHMDDEFDGKITCRLDINTGDVAKYTYSNGDSYEWIREKSGYSEHINSILLNGELVYRAKYREGWLENGNYGNKLIEELPIEEKAVV